MNLCLGMLIGPDEPLLEKIIPHLTGYTGIVALATLAEGATAFPMSNYMNSIMVVDRLTNWGEARNKIITEAERLGFDWMLMLDADEWIDVEKARQWCVGDLPVRFPRIEFVGDSGHYDPTLFPDYQTRLFPLHKDYHYKGAIHEWLAEQDDSFVASLLAADCPIYHYGKCKDHDKVWLHQHNYTLMARGEPTLTELPANYVRQPVDTSKLRVWHGYQPIKIP